LGGKRTKAQIMAVLSMKNLFIPEKILAVKKPVMKHKPHISSNKV
jgi:hypothetical protein